jgi:uncharacterized damage-inducible protein DinB
MRFKVIKIFEDESVLSYQISQKGESSLQPFKKSIQTFSTNVALSALNYICHKANRINFTNRMKRYFLKLYEYNGWANKRVLRTLVRQHVNDEKIMQLMGHIVAAQFLWLHRIKGLPPPDVKLWGEYKLDALVTLAEKAGKEWLEFVNSTDNFNREMTYKNYVGDLYTNNVEMIMIHLVNHSSYHRAQIAMLLRQKGFEPINTDFITYDRVITGQLKD